MLKEFFLSVAIAVGPGFQSMPQQPPVVTDRAADTIYIGDSRFNGMEMHVGKGEGYVIAEDCMGYYWLKGDAIAKAQKIRAQHPEASRWTLVSNLGVNDLHDAELYIRFYKQLEDMGYRVVVVSVNPSDKKRKGLNRDIDQFNARMAESGLEYLDLCGHLRETGFGTTDGLHYQKGTSLEIWNEINTYLASRPAGGGTASTDVAPEEAASAGRGAQEGEDAADSSKAYSGWLCLQPAAQESTNFQGNSGNDA